MLVQDLPPQRGRGGGRGGGQARVGFHLVLDVAGGGDGADGHPHGVAGHVGVLRHQRPQDQPLLPTQLPFLKVQPPKVGADWLKMSNLLFPSKVRADSLRDHNPARQGGGRTFLILQVYKI